MPKVMMEVGGVIKADDVEPVWVSAKTASRLLDISRDYFDRHIKNNLTQILLGKARNAGIRYDLLELKNFCANLKRTNCVSPTGEMKWKSNSKKERIATTLGTLSETSSEHTLMSLLSARKKNRKKRK